MSRAAPRTSIAVQLTIFLIAVTMVVPAVSPNQAMAGGPWVKSIFIARIAALLAIAHWMLRRRSLGWSDVGLSRPNGLRFAIAAPAGVLMIFSFGALANTMIARLGVQSPDYSTFAPLKDNIGQYLFWLLPVSIGTAAFGQEIIFRGL